ncbi:MAG: hypothetical protein E4H17_01055 [Gemmatimonadales bacterium]|nr:MAG: hypothetical protein E4H17_01055 [Gemmatimonadales bacterium]
MDNDAVALDLDHAHGGAARDVVARSDDVQAPAFQLDDAGRAQVGQAAADLADQGLALMAVGVEAHGVILAGLEHDAAHPARLRQELDQAEEEAQGDGEGDDEQR